MKQYILLIQNNTTSDSTEEEWSRFFALARGSGFFKGGSEVGDRVILGDSRLARASDHIVGYMRFDSDDRQKLLELLNEHPVVIHGGSVELCEMPKSQGAAPRD